MSQFTESAKKFLTSKNLFQNWFAFYAYTTALLLAAAIVFSKIPEGNQRLADVLFGSVITGIIMTVINFKFGSSSSSKDKDNTIKEMLDKKSETPIK